MCFQDGATLRPLHEARRLEQNEFEKQYLERALQHSDGHVSRAAELAGVSRQMMTRLIAKHGLRARDRQNADNSE